jgi:uncharacterized protein (TIGR03435 family)
MVRIWKACLAIGVWLPLGCAQPAGPAFEVASVKPSGAADGSAGWRGSPGYLTVRNYSLKALIRIAYRVRDEQIVGGPKWIDSERFDVDARAAGPAKDPELMDMLETLLAQRFQLALHRETKTVTGYALVVPKGGALKIRPDAAQGNGEMTRQGKLVAWGISMARVAQALSRILASPVTDQTGAAGFYSFTLEWTPDTAQAPGPDGAADGYSGPSLFTVLQQQLGLKLEPRKDPIEILAIDRAERPAEN